MGIIIFKIFNFFKSGFSKCKQENIGLCAPFLLLLLGSFKDMKFDEIYRLWGYFGFKKLNNFQISTKLNPLNKIFPSATM